MKAGWRRRLRWQESKDYCLAADVCCSSPPLTTCWWQLARKTTYETNWTRSAQWDSPSSHLCDVCNAMEVNTQSKGYEQVLKQILFATQHKMWNMLSNKVFLLWVAMPACISIADTTNICNQHGLPTLQYNMSKAYSDTAKHDIKWQYWMTTYVKQHW